jgi:hypothetical protein
MSGWHSILRMSLTSWSIRDERLWTAEHPRCHRRGHLGREAKLSDVAPMQPVKAWTVPIVAVLH